MRLISLLPNTNSKARFSLIYRYNGWGDRESRSGPGSRRDSGCVRDTVDALDMAVRELGITSIADIPCGDFNWMPTFLARHPGIDYRGFDIVDEVVEDNRRRHPARQFEVLDIVEDVPPRADLILCKDLFNHLSYADVGRAIDNMIRSGSSYLLASNNFGAANSDFSLLPFGLLVKGSRLLDITAPPLSCRQPVWSTHYLGLWSLADMRRR